MTTLRAVLRDHRGLAALVIAFALAMKALVPGGYMVASQSKVVTVSICADAQGEHLTRQIAIPLDGKGAKHQSKPASDGAPCGFGLLAMASLSAADFVVLAAALAFILALGFAPAKVPVVARTYFARPPLRGPPASA